MRELTMMEHDLVTGGGVGDDLVQAGNDTMVAGGTIAAVSLITPVPDGEVVGAAVFVAGAITYGVGRVVQAFGG